MTNSQTARDEFLRNGYITVRSLFGREEIDFYKTQLEVLSVARKEKWTQADGVCQNPVFWDVIFNEKILAAVRALFGNEVKFLQHNDLHVGFSSYTWHRDSVCRDFGKGPDWDETAHAYQLVRVGIYLQESLGGFRLGMIPGSHRPGALHSADALHDLQRHLAGVSQVLSAVTRRDPLEDYAQWVPTEPGDCVIFDPRTLHTGGEFTGTKYSFFVAYGVESPHFTTHYSYYRHLRRDLQYAALHPDLVTRLKDAGLYAQETLTAAPIEGAWIPSKAYSAVVKRITRIVDRDR